MLEKEYYLGLDLGVASVGWAVTDANYHLIRAKGKDLWGIRKFSEASTSVERRTHRINRRRRQREVMRNNMLRAYFEEEIRKIDPYFFERLKNSKYYLEDKTIKTKNAIFNDPDYQDKDYYNDYPTIFHLRQELIHNENPHDIRLVYLALLNMFKHRGHFLNDSFDENQEIIDMGEVYDAYVETVRMIMDIQLNGEVDKEKLLDLLSTKKLSKSKKYEALVTLCNIDKKNLQEVSLYKLLCGLKVDLVKLFHIDTEEKVALSFQDGNYDEQILTITEIVGEENTEIIERAKAVYDTAILSNLLQGYDYLSDARVASYNKHKKDLKLLKSVYTRLGLKADKEAVFRGNGEGSYSAYVNSNNAGEKQRRSYKNRTADKFYATIKKSLKDIKDDKDVDYILTEIENNNFMPKQLTSSNGIIPNKIYRREMSVILKNAENYLPFLKEKNESGLSVSERILALFSFTIPYYIGPTSPDSEKYHGNGWVVRKESGLVLPWNLEQKIDVHETQVKFIERLIRDCTYLSDEKVLPKASLMYEKYAVLNEINNLKIDDMKIDVSLKQDIFRDLYLSGKKVTKKGLTSYLMNRNLIQNADQISGIDINLNNQLNSYMKFYPILKEKLLEDRYQAIVEDIIKTSTIYGDAKDVLKKIISEKYSDVLSSKDIKRILGYKFKDWGKLSKEFLELRGMNKETGEIMSLMQALWETNDNMMVLINSDYYTFKEELEKKQNKIEKEIRTITIDDLDEIHPSAPVKRMMWQTILIIREITHVLGKAPARIFVEMTRSHENDPQRKDSRQKQLLELYKAVKEDQKNWIELINKANDDGTIRSKKMYLYLKQMGRDLYTGKEISLDELFNDNCYDIDHIYPRHYVKDDNLENNLVLVDKRENARKSDSYPISHEIQDNKRVQALWKTLHGYKLMNDEKYRRLTSRQPFTDEQKADFIARQYVETSQGTKGIGNLLQQILPETEIVFAKASNVSDFRKNNNLLKSRIVNDFHHAHDAYLNIVVGNVYYTKFTKSPMNFIKEANKHNTPEFKYNLARMFNWNVERNGQVAWIAHGENKTIDTVKKTLSRGTPIETAASFVEKGALSEQTLHSAKNAKPGVYSPLKTKDTRMLDVKKYGGFKSATIAYFFLVEYDDKKTRVRSIESLPLLAVNEIGDSKEKLEEYCREELKLKNPSVRLTRIKKMSYVRVNGYYYYVAGKTNKQLILHNAVNLKLSVDEHNAVKKLENAKKKNKYDDFEEKDLVTLYDLIANKFTESIFVKRFNPMGDKLTARKDIFEKLSKEDKVEVLLNIFELVNIGPVSADLKKIKESGNCGVMLMSKKISGYKECKLINRSPAGLYEETIDLLKV